MAEVRCWAIGIDEVREMFAASPTLSARLLELAEPAFPVPPSPPPRPGLLGKLGPLLRRPPDAPVVTPGSPTRLDAESLVRGRFVPQSRLEPAWVLVERWLDDLAWSHARFELTDHELDSLDFDLARAGVVSQHGVRHLWGRDARLTLRPLPGAQVGYLRYQNALALADDWARALPQLEGDAARTAAEVTAFLDGLRGAADAASEAGRPTPDVVTLRTH